MSLGVAEKVLSALLAGIELRFPEVAPVKGGREGEEGVDSLSVTDTGVLAPDSGEIVVGCAVIASGRSQVVPLQPLADSLRRIVVCLLHAHWCNLHSKRNPKLLNKSTSWKLVAMCRGLRESCLYSQAGGGGGCGLTRLQVKRKRRSLEAV